MGAAPSTPVPCADFCSQLAVSSTNISDLYCTAYKANDIITQPPNQYGNCGTNFTALTDLCRVQLNAQTIGTSTHTYMEVWLPNNNASSWNGRTMSSDNGGLNGCTKLIDMEYSTSKGFAAIGDNAGHNSSSFDGRWMYQNNEAIIDWVYRARHTSVTVGKEIVNQFYRRPANKSYYYGCSTGGAQGLHAAMYYPDDFDGIIAGSAAADYNHLQDWSSRFIQMTGMPNTNDSRYLNQADWLQVQLQILSQCDTIDGVSDGILEDPTLCKPDLGVLACSYNSSRYCLSDDQVTTVRNVFTELYDQQGHLLFPSMTYGSAYDAFRLGQFSSIQGIAQDWFRGGVHNDTSFDVTKTNHTDYILADSQDTLHGNISTFNGDLSTFAALGKKMIMFHGLADPLVPGTNSQRFYLKVAKTMGLDYTGIDPFMRLFRVSGMSHCGVGGIAGAGAWMFGQNLQASAAQENIIDRMVSWVENGQALDTLTGTKFNYDLPAQGIQFTRPHCRFPYRTTYQGGDYTQASSWGCTLISNWQDCAVGASPRLCNVDGTFE